jgi:hypothetical protein
MREPLQLAGLAMALAIGACAVEDSAEPAPAKTSPAPRLATAEPMPAASERPAAPAARSTEPPVLRAIAADLANSGEPMVVVAGWRDRDSAAGVPVYAQRNGGWRRLTTGEWPDGAGSIARAVDAADLDGDGAIEVAAFGRVGDGGEADRARLAVFRLRDRELEQVAEVRWQGAEDRLWLIDSDGDGSSEVVVGGRGRRAVRAFSLEGDALVARAARGAGPKRNRESVEMSLPGAGGPFQVAVRPATGGAPMLATLQQWNAELARLRPR